MRIIAGTFKGRSIKTPKTASTRPTQSMLREAIFNICQNEIEGSRFLDLFAGSGAMGIEALSRGAAHATFVEQNRTAIQCIKENIANFHLESVSRLIPIHFKRALVLLEKEQFDLIYIDPPYDMSIDLTSILPLLHPTGLLFLEERHNPKNPKTREIPGLMMKDTRHFAAAQLTIYKKERTS